MKGIRNTLLIIVVSLTSLNSIAQKRITFKPKEVYKSKDLIITQIAKNFFEHTLN